MRTGWFMASVLGVAGIGMGLAGCASQPEPQPNPRPVFSPTTIEHAVEGVDTFAMPVFVRGSRLRLVPFRMEIAEEPGQPARDPFRFRSSSGRSMFASTSSYMDPTMAMRHARLPEEQVFQGALHRSHVRWHNVAFLRPDEGVATDLLLDQRAVISEWSILGEAIPPEKEGGPVTWRLHGLLFVVTERDTDADGMLTDRDAKRLYVTDTDGRRVLAATPPEANAAHWFYDQARHNLYVQLEHEQNAEGEFQRAGRRSLLVVHFGDEHAATPLVDPATSDRAKRLLDTTP